MDLKRKAEDSSALVAVKKTRTDLVVSGNDKKSLIEGQPARTSNLESPIMLLTGHTGEVFCSKISPDGDLVASAGYDRAIFLWEVYGNCDNLAVIRGHTGPIIDLHFSSDGDYLYTCSTDKVVCTWDIETCSRIKKLKGHTTYVNSVCPARRGPQIIVSGSDDGTVKVWDVRRKAAVHTLQSGYQVLAVAFSDTAELVYSGGIDNDVKVWDLRKASNNPQSALQQRLSGHVDSVTGLSVSPDGSYLLSNSMDQTLKVWDIRPYAPTDRCIKVFTSHQHTFEKNLLRCCWSPEGSKISAGSGDRFLHIWDVPSRKLLYKLPGHTGSVNDTHFHPTEPIIVSGSSDKTLYLGEIEQPRM